MIGFAADTYQEAVYEFQKTFTNKLRDVLVHIGWKSLPESDKIKQINRNVWGHEYFHIDFKGLVPYKADYKAIESVTLDRTPDKAAERIYTNRSSTPTTHTYEHQKDVTTRTLSSTTNMQGLEVSNKFTIGTGESAAVKVENETEIKVSASFEQHKEEETTTTDSETDTTEIVVPEHTRIRVTQAKWKSKIKQTDEVHILCQPAFEIYSHAKWIPRSVYPNKNYKKRGKFARRALAFSNLTDFKMFLKGICPDHKNARTNYLDNEKVAETYEWMESNTAFRKIEETMFLNASFGEVVVEDI